MVPSYIKQFCCCCITFFFSITAYTQINITGRVVDENDNTPIPGASVYFNNTTISTRTDNQGNFSFETIRLLNTELVISCAGYELLVYKPVAEKIEKKRVVFKMRIKAKPAKNKLELTDVVRRKCLRYFYENFLGITREASKCTISNEPIIVFGEGDNNTSFTAYADTPVIIINNLLGYRISYNLVEFFYDDATGQGDLVGYSRYEVLGNDKKFAKNRKDCYDGSTLHFYRALVNNQVYEQGFNTFLVQPLIDTGKKTLNRGEMLVPEKEVGLASPITAANILTIDSANNLAIKNNGSILVQYYKDPASKEFLERNGFTAGYLPRGVESYIMFKAPTVGINIAGVLGDTDAVKYSGFWMYEKAANVLPYDYQPE